MSKSCARSRIDHFLSVLRTAIYSFFKQRTYKKSGIKLHYMLKKMATSDALIVVFPAVTKKPFFNYVDTFRKIDVNVLFLKDDFKGFGTYFLSAGGGDLIFDAVDDLTRCVLSRAKARTLIAVGSSKGGSCALFWALRSRNKVDRVIIGSPQFYLGSYFYNCGGADWLKRIMGDCSKQMSEDLDRKCLERIKNSSTKPIVHLVSSCYEDPFHVADNASLRKSLSLNGIPVEYFDGKFKGHSGMAPVFKKYMVEILGQILKIENEKCD